MASSTSEPHRRCEILACMKEIQFFQGSFLAFVVTVSSIKETNNDDNNDEKCCVSVQSQLCMQRLQHRGRPEELGVELDYLDKLHNQHEKWLVERSTE